MGGSKFYGVNIYGYNLSLGGGPPPRKLRNMKCSRSDSSHILCLLRVTFCSEPTYSLLSKTLYFPYMTPPPPPGSATACYSIEWGGGQYS